MELLKAVMIIAAIVPAMPVFINPKLYNGNGTMWLKKMKLVRALERGEPANRKCNWEETIIGHQYPKCCGLCESGGNLTFGSHRTVIGPILKGDLKFSVEKSVLNEVYSNTQCKSVPLELTRSCDGTNCVFTPNFKEYFKDLYIWEFADGDVCAKDQYSGCTYEDIGEGDCAEILWKCQQGFKLIRPDTPDPTTKPNIMEQCQSWNTDPGAAKKMAMACTAIRVQRRTAANATGVKCNYLTTAGTGFGKGVVIEDRPSFVIEGDVFSISPQMNNLLVTDTSNWPNPSNNDGLDIAGAVIMGLCGPLGEMAVGVFEEIQILQIQKALVRLENEINSDIVTIQDAINTDRQSFRNLQAVSTVNTIAIHTILIKDKIDILSLDDEKGCDLLKKDGISAIYVKGKGCSFTYPYGQLLSMLGNIDTSNITLKNVTVDNFNNGGLFDGIGGPLKTLVEVIVVICLAAGAISLIISIIKCVFKRD